MQGPRWSASRGTIEASAIAAPPSLEPQPQLNGAERAELAEKLGYRKIGAELPDDVSLTDIISSMPKEVRHTSSYLRTQESRFERGETGHPYNYNQPTPSKHSPKGGYYTHPTL